MKYYVYLVTDIKAGVFCFDLVRGMDFFVSKTFRVVYADPNVDKDFHNGKRLPRFCDNGEEDIDYNVEMCKDGNFWYFEDHYSSNGDFRITACDGVTIHHGEDDFEVIAEADNKITKFHLFPNQAMIRELLVLMFLKQTKQSHSLSKVPVELFRLLKSFLEN